MFSFLVNSKPSILLAERRAMVQDENSREGMLKQLQVRFACDEVDADEISELLLEVGILSVSVEVEAMKDVLNDEAKWSDLQKQKSWDRALLRCNFPQPFDHNEIISVIRDSFPRVNFDFSIEEIENKDWITHVQESWTPQIIGDDLTIRFPWHDKKLIATSKELVLEGGAAFGTGDHPTTRLCCRWLQDILKMKNQANVLDYGCGSAILGLASLLFGAKTATGIDIDVDALRSARNNCKLNNLHMDLYCTADVESPSSWPISPNGVEDGDKDFKDIVHLKGTFEITVANILAPILILLVDDISKRTAAGGNLAMSGLVSQQADAVINAYRPYFNDLKVQEEEEGWILITGSRNLKKVGSI